MHVRSPPPDRIERLNGTCTCTCIAARDIKQPPSLPFCTMCDPDATPQAAGSPLGRCRRSRLLHNVLPSCDAPSCWIHPLPPGGAGAPAHAGTCSLLNVYTIACRYWTAFASCINNQMCGTNILIPCVWTNILAGCDAVLRSCCLLLCVGEQCIDTCFCAEEHDTTD